MTGAATRSAGVRFGTFDWIEFSDPAQMRERALEPIDATGIKDPIAAFAFGAMSTAQLRHSMGPFAEQVLPAPPRGSEARVG